MSFLRKNILGAVVCFRGEQKGDSESNKYTCMTWCETEENLKPDKAPQI
jgi:hypothetical protein